MNRPSSLRNALLLVLVTLLSLVVGAAAATPATSATSATPATPASVTLPAVAAPVVVFNRTVAVLRAPLLGITPADRARHSEARLAEILARPGSMKVSVTATDV